MTQSSVLLQSSATSALSVWWTIPLLVWVTGTLTLRSAVLIDRRAVDRAAHQWFGWMVVVVVLREPWTQHLLEGMGFELSDIRVLTHTAALAAAVAILLLGLYWRDDRLPAKRLALHLYLGAASLGVALWIISLPAREHHIAVEELENWRTGLYFAIYDLPTPLAASLMALTALGLVLERSTLPRLVLGVLLLGAIIGSTIDHAGRLASGIFLSFGVHNGLTEPRGGPLTDLMYLPILTAITVVAFPSIVTSIRVRRGRDASSQAVKILGPVWNRLTAAMPDYRLNQTHSLASPAEQEHRMRIEIEDTIEAMNRYLPAGEQWPQDPVGRARMLDVCIRRHESAHHPDENVHYTEPPSWLQSESQVLAMAAAWSELRPQQPPPGIIPAPSNDRTR